MLKAPIEIAAAPYHAASRPTAARERAPSGFSALIDSAAIADRPAPRSIDARRPRESADKPRDVAANEPPAPTSDKIADASPQTPGSEKTQKLASIATTSDSVLSPEARASESAILDLKPDAPLAASADSTAALIAVIVPVSIPQAAVPIPLVAALGVAAPPSAVTAASSADAAAAPKSPAAPVISQIDAPVAAPVLPASSDVLPEIAAPKVAAAPVKSAPSLAKKPDLAVSDLAVSEQPASDLPAEITGLPEPAKTILAAPGTKADEKAASAVVKADETVAAEQTSRVSHLSLAAPTAAPSADTAPPPIALPPTQPPIHAAAPMSPTAHFTATIAGGAPVPLNGLAVEIATRNQGGASSFAIRLDPADLGRIDVRLDVDNQGRVTSHLTVEKPETLALLRQDAPQLQRALNDAGLKTSDNALQFSLGDQASAQQNADRGADRQPQRLIIRDDDIIAAPAQLRGYGRMAGTRGGIDIRV